MENQSSVGNLAAIPPNEKQPIEEEQLKRKRKAEDLCLLRLIPFQPTPQLSFGECRLKQKKLSQILIENCSSQMEQKVELCHDESVLNAKGVFLSVLEVPGESQILSSLPRLQFQLGPGAKLCLAVSWLPLETGPWRFTLQFKCLSDRQLCFSVVLSGLAISSSNSESLVKTRSVSKRKFVADDGQVETVVKKTHDLNKELPKLRLLNRDQKLMPNNNQKTNDYLHRNSMFDLSWQERQERAFQQWINFEFRSDSGCFKSSSSSSSSFSDYTRIRNLESTRRAAMLLYQSESFHGVWKRLAEEIDHKRIAIKSDLNFVSDIGLREEIFNVLGCYCQQWLVLGLEVILGITVSDPSASNLTTIISTKFLNHSVSVNSLKADEHLDFIGRVVTKRILLLVLFLDKAKLTHLITSSPPLFKRDSKYKSSREILQWFSTFLAGEGDLQRHLLFLGYSVSYKQCPIDEYDFTVTNLSTDLRDGVRFAKLVEFLSGKTGILAEMKYPASTRQLMVSNLTRLFNLFQELKFEFGAGIIEPKHIVDGHREKTLALIWELALQWRLTSLVPMDALSDEISILKREYKNKAFDDEETVDLYFHSEPISLLFRWAQMICHIHGLAIRNFSSSFANGRAFCALLHHYHPALLSWDSVRHIETNEKTFVGDSLPKDGWIGFSPTRQKKNDKTTMAQYNIRLFSSRLLELGEIPCLLRASDVSGGSMDEHVVIMTVCFLASRILSLRKEIRAAIKIQEFYRARLQQRALGRRLWAAAVIKRFMIAALLRRRTTKRLSKYFDAAVRIQRFWRGALFRMDIDWRVRLRAFQAISRGLITKRSILKKHSAAAVIQSGYHRYRRQQEAQKHQIATFVQSHARGVLARRYLAEVKASIQAVQAYARGYAVRKQIAFAKSAVLFQSFVRKFLIRNHIQRVRYAASMIQICWRSFIFRKRYSHAVCSIKALQSFCRGNLARKHFRIKKAVRTIESRRAGLIQSRILRDKFLLARSTIATVQSFARGILVRFEIQKRALAVRKVQSCFRSYCAMKRARQQYLATKLAIIALQRRIRANILTRTARLQYLSYQYAAVLLQKNWRMQRARAAYRNLYEASVKFQTRYRANREMRQTRQKYLEYVASITAFQEISRYYLHSRRMRNTFLSIQQSRHVAAALIQSKWRTCVIRRRYINLVNAATKIASFYRMKKAKTAYLSAIGSVKAIGAYAKGFSTRSRIKMQAELRSEFLAKWILRATFSIACFRIQRAWRTHCLFRREQVLVEFATAFQSYSRGALIRQKVYRIKESVSIISKYYQRQILLHTVKKIRSSAVRIQSVWRGYLARVKCSALIIEVRRRLSIANAAVKEENKICNRAIFALETMSKSSNLSAIFKACVHLDVVTRLSKKWCLVVVEHDAISVLFSLIKSSNRSRPHIEVMKLAARILLSLSQFSEISNSNFFNKHSLEIVMELIQNYREIDEIFLPALKVLQTLASYPKQLEIIKSDGEFSRKLTSIYSITDRKIASDVKSKKILESKHKMYEAKYLLSCLMRILKK